MVDALPNGQCGPTARARTRTSACDDDDCNGKGGDSGDVFGWTVVPLLWLLPSGLLLLLLMLFVVPLLCFSLADRLFQLE